ncbi:TetR/AcrR family transcriptional regulator [Rhodococcus wratislaviensis]|uniref:TetR/AcrR family transcriptional regulator n=1 Tax=Rhodococcus wratislaviensis TaxID=44752 RepID=UPI001788B65E|nr:TetR family transcriptional regulator [Rhodococcus wratislaviensis]
MTGSAPKAKRSKGAESNGEQRSPLDRKLIAAKAMELLQEVGAEKLTMRALAGRLNVSAMALYHHVEDKDELLRLVGDDILGNIKLPDPESAPWRELFTLAVQSSVDALLSLPGLGAVLLTSKLLPNARDLVVYSVRQFERAGLTHAEAQTAYAGVHQLVLGRLFVEESKNFIPRTGPAGDNEISRYIATLRDRQSFEIALSALLDRYSSDA